MQGAPALVASFAEYRPDHLHPGVDLSTGGRTGLPVYAVMGGEIFRLKVEWRGYGRAIYLRHADGRISVYAHLEGFDEARLKLETRVEEARKATGSRYPGDIYLEPPVPVSRGQQIATSGESGAGLPHLHLELRKDEQRPGDPAAVLGRLPPGEPPRPEVLVLLPGEAGVWIDGGRTSELRLLRDGTGTYVPGKAVVVTGPFVPEARIAADDADGHRLGVRGLSVKLDGKLVYRTVLKEFSFDQYPQVGLLLDHARSRLSPSQFTYRLVRLPGNHLGLDGPPGEAPWPTLAPGLHQLQWEAFGALGGTAKSTIPFRVVSPPRLRWEELPAPEGGLRLALHAESASGNVQEKTRIVYSILGEDKVTPCGERELLPDGESCTFQVLSGARGLTGTAMVDGTAVARATHPFPLPVGQSPPHLQSQVVPGIGFVDLEVRFTASDRFLPVRLVLEDDSGALRLELTEREPGVLLASVPLERWLRSKKVEAEWDTPGAPVLDVLPLVSHVVTPEQPLEMEDCGLRVSFPAGSVFAPTAVACADYVRSLPAVVGLDLKSRAVQLLPGGTPLSRKAMVTFSIPAGVERTRRLGVYRLDPLRDDWAYLGGDLTAAGITIPVGRFDTWALLEDRSPPRIVGVEPSLGSGSLAARPRFVIRVEDEGSGLNYDGVHLSVDGRELEMEYDPDRGWSVGAPTAPYSNGSHSLRLWAEDRSGNRTEDAIFTVVVR